MGGLGGWENRRGILVHNRLRQMVGQESGVVVRPQAGVHLGNDDLAVARAAAVVPLNVPREQPWVRLI